MKIWGQIIVKNEDRYIWFAVKSVIDYLDKILIWDTGSTDNTIEIIKYLEKGNPGKIEFRKIGEVDADGLTKFRQRMLDETKSDWLLVVDGDEIWWERSIQEVLEIINKHGEKLDAIVTPVINVIGDIYHYQEEAAGQYQILGKKGHFNLRAINRKIPGLHIKNHYPLEGFYDKNERLLQDNDSKLILVDAPLLHFTHLSRSTFRKSTKIKYELGIPFPKNFKYPEVLYLEKPSIVQSPWGKMSSRYKLRAVIETPLKKLKRRIF